MSEHTQVELVYSEHNCEQVEFKTILSYSILVIFNIFGFIETKRTSSKPVILCVIILKQV